MGAAGFGRLGEALLVGGLVVMSVLPLIVSALMPGSGNGFTPQVVLALAAMSAYAGFAAWALAGHRRRAWHGALAGFLILGAFAVVAVVTQAATGSLPEGETVFSTIIELPFWLGLIGVPGALVGIAAWLAAAAAVGAGGRWRTR